MKQVRVLNMTRLFDKEMLIYSFFDVKLSKPARVVFIAYLALLFLLIGLPMLIFLPLNPYLLMIEIGIPILGASLMSKPIWGGKKFFDFMKTQLRFIPSPRFYYDCNPGKKLESHTIDFELQVSRRKDYETLMIIEQERIDRDDKKKTRVK